jgi:hypothetical protein
LVDVFQVRRQDPEIREILEIPKIPEMREMRESTVVWSGKSMLRCKKRQPSSAGQAERSGRETQRFPVGTCMAARDAVAATSIRK